MNQRSHVLVVDDNPMVTRSIKRKLQSLGYCVSTAHSAFDGMDTALRNGIDLVVADYSMPGITGEGLIDAIRRDNCLCDMPIILITGMCQSTAEVYRQQYGLAAILYKPFAMDTLASAVAAAIGRGQQPEKTSAPGNTGSASAPR